jgi:hypothetical protein
MIQSSQQHDYKNCRHANRRPSMVHRAQDKKRKIFTPMMPANRSRAQALAAT